MPSSTLIFNYTIHVAFTFKKGLPQKPAVPFKSIEAKKI